MIEVHPTDPDSKRRPHSALWFVLGFGFALLLIWAWSREPGIDALNSVEGEEDAHANSLVAANAEAIGAGRSEIDTEGTAMDGDASRSIRGICVEFFGMTPVADAKITLERTKDEHVLSSTTSGSDGSFALRVPAFFRVSCAIVIRAPKFLPLSRIILAGKRNVPEEMGSIHMLRPVRIGVSIMGPADKPVGAHVELMLRAGGRHLGRQVKSSSGARFFVGGLHLKTFVDEHGKSREPLIAFAGRWAVATSGRLAIIAPEGGIFDADVSRHVYVRLSLDPQKAAEIVQRLADGYLLLRTPPKWHPAIAELVSESRLQEAIETQLRTRLRESQHPTVTKVAEAKARCIRRAVALRCFWTFARDRLSGPVEASGFEVSGGLSMQVETFDFVDSDDVRKRAVVFYPSKILRYPN